MDLTQSVIMPREDFQELQIAAWDQTPTPLKERVAQTTQTTLLFVAMAAAVTAGTWGWAKAVDWKNQRDFERHLAETNATTPDHQ